jgi:molybdenum cofactor cytidylyltransferase
VIAAIVLAAGLARRMGRQKLLLPLRGQPLVRLAVEGILPRVDEVVVVTGHEALAVREALAGLPVRFAHNPRPEDGQASSIAVGMRALPASTRAVLVVLGDQPDLPPSVAAALIAAWRRTGKPVVAPLYRGTQANPVLFGAAVFGELAAITGEGGARAVVQSRPERVEWVAFDLPVPVDVDTPEDYAKLM